MTRTSTSEIDKFVEEHTGKHFCGCPCKGVINITRHHHYEGIPQYLPGHHNKGRENPWSFKSGKDHPCYGKTGEFAPSWKGGLSFLPYCPKFNPQLREAVRIRDNYTCQNPDCGCKENGIKLDVHHVHYDKENCYPDLITLCRSCNVKANSNRDYWESLYMEILNDRGLLGWKLTVF
ncbi:Uncharacterised protein [uncultured archaeon]|nr:Uncharacterised protein [uncultured archaeon]